MSRGAGTVVTPPSDALAALTALEAGWLDGDAGEPITESALRITREVLEVVSELGAVTPSVFPTESGGVRLFWSRTETMVTVDVDPCGELYAHTADIPPGLYAAADIASGETLGATLAAWLV